MNYNNKYQQPWTENEDDIIQRGLMYGLSPRKISNRLITAGFQRTRNAVIGRIHRNDDKFHAPTVIEPEPVVIPKSERPYVFGVHCIESDCRNNRVKPWPYCSVHAPKSKRNAG